MPHIPLAPSAPDVTGWPSLDTDEHLEDDPAL
jgi:hypothetical protein